MKLKIGDVVEVMNQKEVPVSWRIAEILSGNGHTYEVKYDCDTRVASDRMVEKISREFIRPFPPIVQGVEGLAAGDVVEVFYDYSWKSATVMKVLEGEKGSKSDKVQNQLLYLVRLIGCSQQLIVVARSSIRMRQTLCDDKWILMDMGSLGGNDDLANKPSASNCRQKIIIKIPNVSGRAKKQQTKGCMEIQTANSSNSKSLKRMSPYSSSIVEADDCNKKLRRTEKDAYCNEMGISKQNGFCCSQGRSSEVSSSDSDASSVGSCSVNSQSPKNCRVNIPLLCQDTGALCSDAESCAEEKSSFAPLNKKEIEIGTHRLELEAYRSTLKALYVSGPLSWEREALLTNLRDVLHISSDEHLIEGLTLEACTIASRALKDGIWTYSHALVEVLFKRLENNGPISDESLLSWFLWPVD